MEQSLQVEEEVNLMRMMVTNSEEQRQHRVVGAALRLKEVVWLGGDWRIVGAAG
jgi:hypothetical protein